MSKEDLIQEVIENIARCQRPTNFISWQKIGLSHSQVSMLFMLSYHKQLQIKQIASYLSISKSAASQMMDSLSDKGLVLRQPDTKDRRIVYFVPSTKGKHMIKRLKDVKFAGMRSRLDSLSNSDLKTLTEISRKMSAVPA